MQERHIPNLRVPTCCTGKLQEKLYPTETLRVTETRQTKSNRSLRNFRSRILNPLARLGKRRTHKSADTGERRCDSGIDLLRHQGPHESASRPTAILAVPSPAINCRGDVRVGAFSPLPQPEVLCSELVTGLGL
jgi:hypothetical protein